MANKKEKKIKIDIILPNFNSSDSIKETIKSIIDQTFNPVPVTSQLGSQE